MATDGSLGLKKKRFITYRDAFAKDKFLAAGRSRRPMRENCSESCGRYVNFCKFCLVCSASLFQVLAPWVLSSIEVLAVLLIYFLATTRSLVIHENPRKYHFSYMHSLEDIVGLTIARASILSGAYAWGVHRVQSVGCVAHRPYLYLSYLLAALCFPYIIVKTFLFRYVGSDAIPSAAIFIITGAFTWFHVFAARRTLEWARRSYQMGLAGFGFPWEEGDEAWTLLRRPDIEEMNKSGGALVYDGRGAGGDAVGSSEDVPAESLADEDSRFMDVLGIKVHYKEVVPPGLYPSRPPRSHAGSRSSGGSCSDAEDPAAGGAAEAGSAGAGASAGNGAIDGSVGIVLVHGYGGGVFAWRHVMEALALQCQCRVVAFDRPAFGLTSRPPVSLESLGRGAGVGASSSSASLTSSPVSSTASPPANPYTLAAQAELMLQLCSQLGLKRVLVVAHADACLLALRAAATTEGAAAAAAAAEMAAAAAAAAAGGSDPVVVAAAEAAAAGWGSSHPFAAIYSSNPLAGPTASPPPAAGAAGAAPHPGRSSSPSPSDSPGRSHGLPASFAAGAAPPTSAPDASSFTPSYLPGPSASPPPPRPPLAPRALHCEVQELGVASTFSSPTSPFETSEASCSAAAAAAAGGGSGHVSIGVHEATLGPAGASAPAPAPGSADLESGQLHPALAALPPRSSLGPGAAAASASSSSSWGPAGHRPRHRRAASAPGPPVPLGAAAASLAAGAGGSARPALPPPSILGLALLHPNLQGQAGPTLSRLLSRSGFGRSILRPLLRSEVGEVANRRAWHRADRLTPEVLELYKAPLRVQGWDMALMETARLGKDQATGDVAEYLASVRGLPMLVVTATHDAISTPSKVERLWTQAVPHARLVVLPDCGHLSHEEAPGLLLRELSPFAGFVVRDAAAAGALSAAAATEPAAGGLGGGVVGLTAGTGRGQLLQHQ